MAISLLAMILPRRRRKMNSPSVEMAQREHALAFHASVSDLDIGNHGLRTKMMKMLASLRQYPTKTCNLTAN